RVTYRQRPEYVIGNTFEAAVHAQRQAESRAADGLDHLGQLTGSVADHVQNRSKLLALQLVQGTQLEQVGREEVAHFVLLIEWARIQELGLLPHARCMVAQPSQSCLRNHRPDI